MKNQKMLILPLFVLLTLNLILIGCASLNKAQSTNSSAVLDGKTLLEQRCTTCHSLDRVNAMNTDQAGWDKIIDRMIQKGARLNAQERQKVIDYRISME